MRVLTVALSPGAGQPLSAEQREKLVKQKEQYEKAAEKLEDQVKKYLDFKFGNKSLASNKDARLSVDSQIDAEMMIYSLFAAAEVEGAA